MWKSLSFFFLLLLLALFLWWFCWIFGKGVFFCLAANEDSVISLFFADQHWVQFFKLRQDGDREDSEIGHSSKGISVDVESFERGEMFQFLELSKVNDKIAVNVKGF